MPNPPREPERPAWRRYLRFFGQDVEADVDDELRFHLEKRTQELVRRGMDPEAADPYDQYDVANLGLGLLPNRVVGHYNCISKHGSVIERNVAAYP